MTRSCDVCDKLFPPYFADGQYLCGPCFRELGFTGPAISAPVVPAEDPSPKKRKASTRKKPASRKKAEVPSKPKGTRHAPFEKGNQFAKINGDPCLDPFKKGCVRPSTKRGLCNSCYSRAFKWMMVDKVALPDRGRGPPKGNASRRKCLTVSIGDEDEEPSKRA